MSTVPVVINSFISPIQISNLAIKDSPIFIAELKFPGTDLKIENLGIRLPGMPGESAYESAVKGGYTRSEEEFYTDIVPKIASEESLGLVKIDDSIVLEYDGTIAIDALTNQDIDNLLNLFV